MFDIVLCRKFMEFDYVKYLLGKEFVDLGFFDDFDEFVLLRNESEFIC